MAVTIPFTGETILSLEYTGYKLPLSAQEADGSFVSSAAVASNGQCTAAVAYFANNTGLPTSAQSGPFLVNPLPLKSVWQKLKVHILGDQIVDPNGNVQTCTQAGTSAAQSPQVLGGWGFIPGSLTADDNTALHQVIWRCDGPNPAPVAWDTSTAVARNGLERIITMDRTSKSEMIAGGATAHPWQVLTSQSEDQIPSWLFAYNSLLSGAPPIVYDDGGTLKVFLAGLSLAQGLCLRITDLDHTPVVLNPINTPIALAPGSPVFSSIVGTNKNPYQLFGYLVVDTAGAPLAMYVGNGQLNGANADAATFARPQATTPFSTPIFWRDVTATGLWTLHSQRFLAMRADAAAGENLILAYDPTFAFFRLIRLTVDPVTLAPTFTVIDDYEPASDPGQGLLFGSQFTGTRRGFLVWSGAGAPDPSVPNGSPVFLFAPDLSEYTELTFTTIDPAVQVLSPPDIVGPNFATGQLSIPMIVFDAASADDVLLWQNPGLFSGPGSIDPHAAEVYFALFAAPAATGGKIIGTHVGFWAGGRFGGGTT